MVAIQRFRQVSILLLFTSMALPVYLNGPRYLYLYITQWSIELATIAFVVGYLHEKYPQLNLGKVASATLGAAICLAMATMVAFWVAFARSELPLRDTRTPNWNVWCHFGAPKMRWGNLTFWFNDTEYDQTQM